MPYTEENKEKIIEIAQRFMGAINLNEIVDQLFDMQQEMIKSDYLEGMEENSRCAVAYRFRVLMDLITSFRDLETKTN